MSMLGRTGTTVRKNRRRSSSNSRTSTSSGTRRGSAPTVLVPTQGQCPKLAVDAVTPQRHSLTTSVAPSSIKSVSFCLEGNDDEKTCIQKSVWHQTCGCLKNRYHYNVTTTELVVLKLIWMFMSNCLDNYKVNKVPREY
ncbi:hypothetical protein LOTGIDRAFT_153479 [Lottia gigantea]|uniref:Uncharacterized protein n=1 Tax=Lottia gigantea TaxID=225164 RepID=V4AB36_LOTGI|nr:hypothetical protein LOTGIDRAFT_153479 [Lottia gigantea]ESO94002.1 hypothetical protein LOTGIDRAFT_153479 [Lottia gigantea]